MVSFLGAAAILSCFVWKDTLAVNLIVGGAGLRSISIGTALMSSLLSIDLEENEPEKKTLAHSDFANSIEMMTGVSGGCIFLGNLVYSEKFVAMVENITKARLSPDPDADYGIADIYNDCYMKPIEDAGSSATGEDFAIVSQVIEILNATGLAPDVKDFIGLLAAVYEKSNGLSASWSDAMEFLLVDDIPSDATLSFEPQNWARGKSLVLVAAVSMPFDNNQTFEEYLWYNDNLITNQYLKYTVALGNSSVNENYRILPVWFSHVLGAGSETASPIPFAGDMLNSFSIMYEAGIGCELPEPCPVNASTEFGLYHWDESPFTLSSFGDTSLLGAVAASAAFFGLYDTLELKDQYLRFQGLLKFDPTVKYSPGLSGIESFNFPRELFTDIWTNGSLSHEQFDEVTTSGVYSLLDGGVGDLDGIGAMLSSGATEFFVLSAQPIGWQCHFDGGSSEVGCFDGMYQYPLFRESFAEARLQEELFTNLTISENTKYLKYSRYGTVTGTTINSELFRIESGRSVTFHVLIADSDDNLGSFDKDLNKYGILCQEMVHTLTSDANKEVLNDIYNYFVGTKSFYGASSMSMSSYEKDIVIA